MDYYIISGNLGHCQKIKLTKSDEKGVILNRNIHVLGEKIEIGNTYIYFIDDNLQIPQKLENTIPANVQCSRTIQLLDHFNLLKFKSNKDLGYTVFLPDHEAWIDLDLTLDYLLNNLRDLEKVVKGMIFNGLIYDDFIGKTTLSNLNGEPATLKRNVGDSHIIVNNGDDTLPISFDSEILFKDGVAYPVDTVIFPDSLEITMDDLLDTIDASEFIKILQLLGLDKLIKNDHYSFLVPTTGSLLIENITSTFPDLNYLKKFAALHILPGESLDKVLSCEEEIPTFLNDTHLSCRKLASGDLMLQVLEGNDHEVRITRKGFTTAKFKPTKSGLLLIDKPINPSWLDQPNGPIHLHLPFVAILIGVVIGMLLLSLILSCCFVYAIGGKRVDDENTPDNTTASEQTPLLIEGTSGTNGGSGEVSRPMLIRPSYNSTSKSHLSVKSNKSSKSTKSNKQQVAFSANYSEHSSREPIDLPAAHQNNLAQQNGFSRDPLL
ncbi:unnamed protein product [Ambrosiozyma monospora]|uniref:Unnamed protein product n=1 Tax=Ambrosiozyma monospora TaxID=43982 RepID=A0ACB5SUA4_AMBMO|nr:unnamed protein product [Ambrosiozyma monospora]